MNNQETNPRLKKKPSVSNDDMIDNLCICNDRQFIGGNRPNSIVTQEGLSIVIARGSIADQVTDVIVNSVGVHFDLSQGSLSKSILQTAGPKIQKELNTLKTQATQSGAIAVTQGFQLSARFVFHGVLKKWNNGKDDAETVLRVFVQSCLTEADKRRLKSITFPAIGAGILGFPCSLVVDCLFGEADRFSASNPETTVNEIRFVIFEADNKTFDAFEQKVKKIKPDDDVMEDPDSDLEVDEIENFPLSTDHLNDLNRQASKSKETFRQIGISFPKTWKSIPVGKPYGKTPLDPADDEFKMVSKRVMATKGRAPVRSIHKIERIENKTLYQLYTINRIAMEGRNGPGQDNERLLWHGTAVESLNNICAGGFNRSYCGKNAVVYGQGVYFARNFEYSAQSQYSPPDANGTKYIFMSKVLTGTFQNGERRMIEPDMKPGTDFRYDSVVDDVSEPGIFVTFKDAQAYPEYLVSFN